MSFFHVTPVIRPGVTPAPAVGVVIRPLAPGTLLSGSFKLISDSQAFFDAVVAALPDPNRFAVALVPGLRSVINNPDLKGPLDSVVIEAFIEKVRVMEFDDRPSRTISVFGSLTVEAAVAFARRYRVGAPCAVYEVEPVGDLWIADMAVLNSGFEYFAMPLPDAVSQQLDRARTYLREMTIDMSRAANMADAEVLAPRGATVTRTVQVVT
jgi:hypothetical protein